MAQAEAPIRTAALKERSERNVKELQQECDQLAKNNDRLVNVIAQNNASKQTIKDLENRLEYATKNQEEKLVDFNPVNENLDENLEQVKKDLAKQAIIKEQKLEESQKLQDQKTKLKAEQKKLENELKNLEGLLNSKTTESTRVASKKIILEEEINDLEGKIKFEEQHFHLMEEALRLKLHDAEEHGSKNPSNVDHQEFMENLLKDYAKQFGAEYEKLMRRAMIKEKALLTHKLERLREANRAKESDLQELNDKLAKLGRDILENEQELGRLKAELEALENQKNKESQEFVKEKMIKEGTVKVLEDNNDKLRSQIDATQKSANEALKVIIELEFEIKTYERLLKIEEQRGNLSVLENPDARSRKSSSSSSNSSSKSVHMK